MTDKPMTPEEVRTARQTLGISAQALADKIGLADGRTIRKYESGENVVPRWARLSIERAVRDHNDAAVARAAEDQSSAHDRIRKGGAS